LLAEPRAMDRRGSRQSDSHCGGPQRRLLARSEHFRRDGLEARCRSRIRRVPLARRRSSPIVGAVACTFGGLATGDRRNGAPIPGLLAAGEIAGNFYATTLDAVSVLCAFVFGRIAGREAVGNPTRLM
jgi:succinate dehydrogenase/fumarate reductase flavoprotein subunit